MVFDDSRFKLYDVESLLALPEPPWLVDGVISVGALGIVYGPSGAGKTHALLSLALSIAAGHPWFGRRVRPSRVLYVAAEGGRSLGKRIAVWMHEQGIDEVSNLRVLPADVQLVSESAPFLAAIEQIAPEVIVIDPFVECFIGLDENSQKDVGLFLAQLREIRRRGHPTILMAHHTGWEAKHERGSTVLRGAADLVVAVRSEGKTITLKCDKQRDFEKFKDIQFELVPLHALRNDQLFSSVVLRSIEGPGIFAAALEPSLLRTLCVLAQLSANQVTSKQWEVGTGLAPRTFHDHRDRLLKGGYVLKIRKGWYGLSSSGKVIATATAG